MNKIEKLTEEQTRLMYETRDEWINLFFDNVREKRGIDKPAFEEGIKFLYEFFFTGKMQPAIIYFDSWKSCLIYMNRPSVHEAVHAGALTLISYQETVRDYTMASSRDFIRDSVGASVNDIVRASVNDIVRASVVDSVAASVEDSVGDSVWDSVRDSVGNAIKKIYLEYSSWGDISNYGWVSFYDFFSKIGVLNNPVFEKYKNFIRSTAFAVYIYENNILAVHPPIYVERNAAGMLHSTTTAAVKFRDGSGYYFINGRSVPEWVINKKETITKDRFLSEKNAEIKAAIYASLGQEGIMNLLGAEIVDIKEITHANGDIETVELLKTKETFKEIGSMPFAWVKVVCPSTGTNYLLGVEPHHTDAKEAIASLSPFKSDAYSYNYRT